ncbi:hypothetical protein BgiMline_006188, partial [Biomphalaria glabrata]
MGLRKKAFVLFLVHCLSLGSMSLSLSFHFTAEQGGDGQRAGWKALVTGSMDTNHGLPVPWDGALGRGGVEKRNEFEAPTPVL